MWEWLICIGDFLEVGIVKGVVEIINICLICICCNDGVYMLVLNSYLLENIVINWILIDCNVCLFVNVGVVYGLDVVLVEKLMK